MGVDLGEHRRRFAAYTKRFRTGSAEDIALIDLKTVHSLKVMAEAVSIVEAHGDNWSREVRDAAILGALYHDLGRFPQYATYRTFVDRESVNHARLSALAFIAEDLGEDVDADTAVTIDLAVLFHNRRTLPEGMYPELEFAARVVRDADKLDIMRVMLANFASDASDPTVNLHLEPHPTAWSEDFVEDIQAGHIGDMAMMKYVTDFVILLLSWAYDLNFAWTRRQFLERGFVDELGAMLPDDARLEALENKVREHLQT
jgi:hypothetical protein